MALVLNENTRSDNLSKIEKALKAKSISYQLHGKYHPDIVVNKHDLKRAYEISRDTVPELKSMNPTNNDYISILSKA